MTDNYILTTLDSKNSLGVFLIMAKKIFAFSLTERILIQLLLMQRLKFYEDWTKENHKTEVSKRRFRKLFTLRYTNTLRKIRSNCFHYSPKEILAIQSCVKDYFGNSFEKKELCEEILNKISSH